MYHEQGHRRPGIAPRQEVQENNAVDGAIAALHALAGDHAKRGPPDYPGALSLATMHIEIRLG